jgi:glycosyltransferase involved in cell wall biosynthesis
MREYVIDAVSPDVVLTTSMVEGLEDDTIASYGNLHSMVTTVAVIYDLIPLTDPERYISGKSVKAWYHDRIDSIRRADLLLAISEATRVEAISLLNLSPQTIVNISSAADGSFSSANVSPIFAKTVRHRLGIFKKYLMHSSALDARKNFQGLIRAFAALPSDIRKEYQLVLVGKLGADGREELAGIASRVGLGLTDVVLTGFVPDDELVALYSGCHLFVFPSFQEGFGLPPLEAMCCGTPTIGSNVTSIPEVIGREDALFDPTSDESITELILKALTDEAFYESLKSHAKIQSARFSWDETSRRAIRAIENACLMRRSERQPNVDPINQRQALLEAIAKIASDCPPGEQEILDVARCVEANSVAVDFLRASTTFAEPMTWRIEGPFDSSYSLSLLNRETARALSALGHNVVMHSTEGPGDFEPSSIFLEANTDIRSMHARVSHYPHDEVDVVSRNLYPPRVADMSARLNMMHHYAWEESGFPSDWVADFNAHLDGLTCLSTHVEKVLLDNGVYIPLTTSGCGVDHWERVTASSSYKISGRAFRFLHVSSCFPRKGIDVLLAAFGKAFTNSDDVSLIIKTFANPHNTVHSLLAEHRSRNPNYPDVAVIEGDLSESDLKSIYQQSHALVAPSRAEGFGLPLAEAMLTGLPVITTNWSGQLDFCTDETAWLVDYSFEPAQTHFGLPESVWASPHVDALAATLLAVRGCSPAERDAKAIAARRLLLAHFTWKDVAARLVTSAALFQRHSIGSIEPRVGWVTTWNTKCGIASYSQQLIERFPQHVTIFASHAIDLTREDGPECVRSWLSSKEDNHLDELAIRLAEFNIGVVVIQFNYGFYNFRQFNAFVTQQIDAGRAIAVIMHSTGDPGLEPAWNWSLSELVPALQRCQRVLVHTVNDLNRFKELGLVSNVSLFPHGIMESTAPVEALVEKTLPLVATYGFCLPHKGLIEIVSAVAILKEEGNPVRLRLVNAEHSVKESAELLRSIRRLVKESSVDDLVEIYSDYLPEQESLHLLQDVDIVAYPYQQTNESASGAVRLGLASGKPVAVTPLPIFQELFDSVHRFPGTQPSDLAAGIKAILSDIKCQSDNARAVANSAEKWRLNRGYSELSRRLYNICKGLALKVTCYHRVFDGSTRQMRSPVGRIMGRTIESIDSDGFLLCGLRSVMPIGRYVLTIIGHHEIPVNSVAYCDVCMRGGTKILARKEFTGIQSGVIVSLPVSITERCVDFEIRVFVGKFAKIRIRQLEISSTFYEPESASQPPLVIVQSTGATGIPA